MWVPLYYLMSKSSWKIFIVSRYFAYVQRAFTKLIVFNRITVQQTRGYVSMCVIQGRNAQMHRELTQCAPSAGCG